jgi:hypothetical protein
MFCLLSVFPPPFNHRKLTDKLKLLMQPDKSFAEEGDVEGALQGFGPQTAAAVPAGLDGVTAACARAALAHRLYSRRLLPRLRVRLGMCGGILFLELSTCTDFRRGPAVQPP